MQQLRQMPDLRPYDSKPYSNSSPKFELSKTANFQSWAFTEKKQQPSEFFFLWSTARFTCESFEAGNLKWILSNSPKFEISKDIMLPIWAFSLWLKNQKNIYSIPIINFGGCFKKKFFIFLCSSDFFVCFEMVEKYR